MTHDEQLGGGTHSMWSELGAALRDMRLAAGLDGPGIADAMGWSLTKVNEIERGIQNPTRDDLTRWGHATGGHAEPLVDMLDVLDIQVHSAKQTRRMGLGARQRQVGAGFDAASRFRIVEVSIVPGLLQTPAYSRKIFEQSLTGRYSDADIDEAVATRIERQQVLRNPDKDFHCLIAEQALRCRRGDAALMREQINHIASATDLPTLRLGILPLDAHYTVPLRHGFWMYDAEKVTVGAWGVHLTITQPDELALYTKVFDNLAETARYGDDAHTLLDVIRATFDTK